MKLVRSIAHVTVLLAICASFTHAQEASAPRSPGTAAGEDGFAIQSADGAFRLQLGLLLHADGRFALEDTDEQVVDAFVVRRLRPYLRGRFARRFEFYINPDFSGGTLVVHDAYVDVVYSPAFRIRGGKAKAPFGFERLQPAANMLFMERALPTALAPNRDVGIQALGDLAGGTISYLAGVMNGVADGASGDVDTNDAKDVVGRLVLRPFTRIATSPLRGLGVGLSGSAGRQTGAAALPSFRTQIIQQPYASYAGASADGVRTRYSPHLFYFHKSFGGWMEYVHTDMPIQRGAIRDKVAHDAWQVAASVVLTGENATDSAAGVRPRANFDFGGGHFGAFQVAARYHVLRIDAPLLRVLAASGASRKAESWTLGLRWYVTGNLWHTVNFERTVFDGDSDGPRPAENGLAFRTQVGF